MAPAQLDHIITKLLEKDPDLRYQTAADLRSDLRRLHRDTTSGQTSANAIVAVAVQRRQRDIPPRAWIGISAAVLVIAAVVLWFYFSEPAKYSGPPPRIVPFTSSAGSKYSVALSPDGNEIAFSW